MTLLLFVYGTLLPELATSELLPIINSLESVGVGYVRGTLYDLGNYPGAIANDQSPNWIIGKVYKLPEISLIKFFDIFEDFDPNEKTSSLFNRQVVAVQMDRGGVRDCWMYVYNQNNSLFPVIESGDYLSYVRGKSKSD